VFRRTLGEDRVSDDLNPWSDTMAEDLDSIDVSHLDSLARFEADQRAIRALIEKAAWHRDKVVEVYSRVVRDYEARFKALDEQADAVRQRVREDLAALDRIHERCREAVDLARVELQENEFRHEVGEFTRDEFQKRQQAIERTIAERQGEFESVKKLRQRYLDLLPAAPAQPLVVPAAPVVPPPASPAVAAAPPRVAPAPPPVVVPPAEAPPPEEPIPPVEGTTGFPPPLSDIEFDFPPLPEPDGPEAFGTVAVAAALLIEDTDGVPGVHHRLGAHTSIGRTADNQIVVPMREVSRRHAEIVESEAGYTLKDLGSPNGTYVNGERITEHELSDGDRIAVGPQMYVFKAR
jgi:hypothetical protein